MKIFYSEKFLEHDTGALHPESPKRLTAILDVLARKKFPLESTEPAPANEKELSLVHDPLYLKELESLEITRKYFPDNPFNDNTFEIAALAAGAARDAAIACIADSKFAFALVRPPGHHAGKDFFSGFCYLNNVAFAAAKMLEERKAKRAMIIDFDVHHGNGTQNIFYNDERVFLLSFNQKADSIFPGTGFENTNNTHIKNVEYKLFIPDEEYLQLFEQHVSTAATQFKPDLVAVSAGFDAFHTDSMVGTCMKIKKHETYAQMGAIIKDACKCPAFGVLEGGYYLDALGENVYNFLKALQ